MALVEAVKESIWLRQLLHDLGSTQAEATLIAEDNQAAMRVAEHDTLHDRSKHIAIRYHFTRDKVAENVVKLFYVPTANMLVDCMTKPLPCVKLHPLLNSIMGVVPVKGPSA